MKAVRLGANGSVPQQIRVCFRVTIKVNWFPSPLEIPCDVTERQRPQKEEEVSLRGQKLKLENYQFIPNNSNGNIVDKVTLRYTFTEVTLKPLHVTNTSSKNAFVIYCLNTWKS